MFACPCPAHPISCHSPPAPHQAGDRGAKKAARAESRGVARKVLKLLSGPLLASEPQAPPRALLLVLASLLVGPACGRKVAASALKAARALEAPLLAGLRGLAATAEAAEEAAGRQPKARKGGKKGDKAAEAAPRRWRPAPSAEADGRGGGAGGMNDVRRRVGVESLPGRRRTGGEGACAAPLRVALLSPVRRRGERAAGCAAAWWTATHPPTHPPTHLVVAEVVEHLLALALAHVAVQRAARQVAPHRRRHLVGLALGLGEHDGLAALAIHGEEVDQHRAARVAGHLGEEGRRGGRERWGEGAAEAGGVRGGDAEPEAQAAGLEGSRGQRSGAVGRPSCRLLPNTQGTTPNLHSGAHTPVPPAR